MAVFLIDPERIQTISVVLWITAVCAVCTAQRHIRYYLAGALPGSLGQLSLPSLRSGYIEYQLTAWG